MTYGLKKSDDLQRQIYGFSIEEPGLSVKQVLYFWAESKTYLELKKLISPLSNYYNDLNLDSIMQIHYSILTDQSVCN